MGGPALCGHERTSRMDRCIGTMLAAGLIAADMGRRVTGFGFVLFCALSVTWIASAVMTGAAPIGQMNAVLLVINAWGVWQYLLSPKNRRVTDRLEPVAERIEAQAEAEMKREGS